METNFTKGTWSVTSQFRLDVEGGYITTQLSGSLDSTVLEREANAHLIAAAPDMYSALDEITKLRDGHMRVAVDWLLDNTDDLIKLLKKARGE